MNCKQNPTLESERTYYLQGSADVRPWTPEVAQDYMDERLYHDAKTCLKVSIKDAKQIWDYESKHNKEISIFIPSLRLAGPPSDIVHVLNESKFYNQGLYTNGRVYMLGMLTEGYYAPQIFDRNAPQFNQALIEQFNIEVANS